MAINTPINADPMAELEILVNSADTKTGSFAPFFFSLKDGQKALIRPLLNLNQYVRVEKHELWNPATKKFEAKAVCAASMQLPDCAYCAQAANAKSQEEKKLTASPRIILPIYVHAVLDVKTGQPVTYTDQEGKEQPVKGVRLLEMKRSSSILTDLINSYNGTDDSDQKSKNDITTLDYVIRREGEGRDTRYTVTPKAPRALPDDISDDYRDREKVLAMYAEACPWKLIEGSQVAPVAPAVSSPPSSPTQQQTQGKVRNAPDF